MPNQAGRLPSLARPSSLFYTETPGGLSFRLSVGHFRLVFIGLHAPHRATERALLEEWWLETRNLARTNARNDPVVLAGDMNAALGSIQSTWVGSHGAEPEDVPGNALHSMLHEFGILLPATWEHTHCGPHHTYVQKRGGRMRRSDYIGVPLLWVESHSQSVLAPDINAGHGCPDHVSATFYTAARCAVQTSRPCVAGRKFKPCDLVGPCAAKVEAAIPQLSRTRLECLCPRTRRFFGCYRAESLDGRDT